MEKEKLKLRAEFELETGITWTNSQGEPDIDYVDWLEEKVLTHSKRASSGKMERLIDWCHANKNEYSEIELNEILDRL